MKHLYLKFVLRYDSKGEDLWHIVVVVLGALSGAVVVASGVVAVALAVCGSAIGCK